MFLYNKIKTSCYYYASKATLNVSENAVLRLVKKLLQEARLNKWFKQKGALALTSANDSRGNCNTAWNLYLQANQQATIRLAHPEMRTNRRSSAAIPPQSKHVRQHALSLSGLLEGTLGRHAAAVVFMLTALQVL